MDNIFFMAIAYLDKDIFTPLISCRLRHLTSASLKLHLSISIWSISLKRSISQYSNTRNTLSLFSPTTTYLKLTILGWLLSIFKILTSLREVIGNPSWLSSTFIFLMATFSSVFLSLAKNTIPYVPYPIISPFSNSPINLQFSAFIITNSTSIMRGSPLNLL